jgi:hypothetical protein
LKAHELRKCRKALILDEDCESIVSRDSESTLELGEEDSRFGLDGLEALGLVFVEGDSLHSSDGVKPKPLAAVPKSSRPPPRPKKAPAKKNKTPPAKSAKTSLSRKKGAKTKAPKPKPRAPSKPAKKAAPKRVVKTAQKTAAKGSAKKTLKRSSRK